jgi:hypothetical protein
MTSIYHRRFYPDDVDATVPYVAPISFGAPDARYIPFLDQIGERDCRETVRDLQREAMKRFDVIQSMAEAEATEATAAGLTFEDHGGHAAAYELAILGIEWGFWQYAGITGCELVPTGVGELDDESLLFEVTNWAGYGYADVVDPQVDAYYYQAASELGYPDYARAHLEPMLSFPDVPSIVPPHGTHPEYTDAPMHDVRDWVLAEGDQMLFIYGEYDPWSGGAFDIGASPGRVKLVAPQATHGATIRSLDDADRGQALDAIEEWVGARPALDRGWRPSRAPLPPGLLREGLPRAGAR